MYHPQKLQLTVIDVSCTEAWLQLKTEQTEKAEKDLTLQIFRDDSLVVNKDWGAGDSLIYLDGLQPATAYAFNAKLLRDNKLLFSSPKVTATTLDTTSHDFTWQTFEFGGQGGSSSFYDVAIIDENDIWAVGEIYTADDKYNAAHWDGEKWELKKIDWDGYVSRLTCVFAFSSNDVWFGVTNLIHWNGNRFEKNINPLLNQFYSKTVNKIWGTSDSNLYIVGNDGMIAHYDGQQWQRIESGTSKNINDIYGIQKNNFKNILCPASNVYEESKGELIAIQMNLRAKKLNWPNNVKIHSVWIKNNFFIYACGDGLWDNKTKRWQRNTMVKGAFWRRIRGTGLNNIFLCGDFGYVAHYNGLTWKSFRFTEVNLFVSLAVKNKVVAIASYDPPVIIRGIKAN